MAVDALPTLSVLRQPDAPGRGAESRSHLRACLRRQGQDPSSQGSATTRAAWTPRADCRSPTPFTTFSMNLAVLPDRTVAVSSKPGSTHLISTDLSRALASWPMSWGWEEEKARTGDPCAASITVTPSGRLLCLTSEYGLSNWAGAHPNIIALSEPGSSLCPGSKATLRAIATHDARRPADRRRPVPPHPVPGHAGGARQPPVPLPDRGPVQGCPQPYNYRDSRLGRPTLLGEGLFVVPVFGRIHRSGNQGQVITFVLFDDQGVVRGRLEGLDPYKGSPFTGFCFTVVADPHRARTGLPPQPLRWMDPPRSTTCETPSRQPGPTGAGAHRHRDTLGRHPPAVRASAASDVALIARAVSGSAGAVS